MTYKRDVSELASVKHLEILYTDSAGSEKLTEDFDDNDPLSHQTFTLKSGGSGAIESKDEIIEVNINIDGNTQTFELKNENYYNTEKGN